MQWISTWGFLLFLDYVSAHPLNTLTLAPTSMSNVSLPEGVTNHGNPKLVCTPGSWFTVAYFILGNYVAHAATTQIFPGEKLLHQVTALITSMMYPGAGVVRGLNSIARGISALRWNTDLQKAAGAGALCMVIRTEDWTPHSQPIHGVQSFGSNNLVGRSWTIYNPPWLQRAKFCRGWLLVDASQSIGPAGTFEIYREIHGTMKKLPNGYTYAPVPPEARIAPLPPECTVHLAQSRNTAKVVVAVLQVIYLAYTLYESRGDQVQRFGFAAFSLTVVPYTVMSMINLIGGLLLPVYPAVFLVQSEVSNEVEHRHGKWFNGAVGSLEPLEDDGPTTFVMQDEVVENNSSAIVLGPKAIPGQSSDIFIPTCPPFQRVQPIFPPFRFPWSNIQLPRLTIPRPILTLSEFPPMDIAIQMVMATQRIVYENLFLLATSFFFAVGLPLQIILVLSADSLTGTSTTAQKVWVPMWFAVGASTGFFLP